MDESVRTFEVGQILASVILLPWSIPYWQILEKNT